MRIGVPIIEYVPIEIDFTLEQSSIDNFQLLISEEQFTLYEVNYSKINNLLETDQLNSSEWIIYGNFTDIFISPNLSEVIPSDINWFNKDLLELNKVKEYSFSEWPNYNDWLENEFDPELTNNHCSHYGLDIGGQIASRSLTFN